MTRWRVAGLIGKGLSLPRSTRETVDLETPATLAISIKVTLFF